MNKLDTANLVNGFFDPSRGLIVDINNSEQAGGKVIIQGQNPWICVQGVIDVDVKGGHYAIDHRFHVDTAKSIDGGNFQAVSDCMHDFFDLTSEVVASLSISLKDLKDGHAVFSSAMIAAEIEQHLCDGNLDVAAIVLGIVPLSLYSELLDDTMFFKLLMDHVGRDFQDDPVGIILTNIGMSQGVIPKDGELKDYVYKLIAHLRG